jgi:alpha-L-arabinofuranosidase
MRSMLRTRALSVGLMMVCGLPTQAQTAMQIELTIRDDSPQARIDPNVYGQFAEHLGRGIYDGIWVGPDSPIPNTRGYRTDVLEALRKLGVPVLRWPGGCFADEYHWRDGIGPRERRPVHVNTNWGGVEESNAFGTHEFLDFAELLGAKAYLSGNMGSGTPQEMAEWVEYITSPTNSTLAQLRRKNGRDAPWPLPYFGLGNETWGCGGSMRPEHSANLHKQFATFIKAPRDNRPAIIASGANASNTSWTDVLLRDAVKHMDAITLHYYTIPTGRWDKKGSATLFDESEWIVTLARTLRMDEVLTNHTQIMDKYDPNRRVGLFVDEWGTWYDTEPGTHPDFLYQQNSLRDALVAAVNLNVFHKHAERVRMTNIAQMVNVLQAMILTQGERMVLTPTYHVFEMYKPFRGATNLPAELTSPRYRLGDVDVPAVHASAARDADHRIHVGLANLDPHRAATVTIALASIGARRAIGRPTGRVLTAATMQAFNSLERPQTLVPAPLDIRTQGGRLVVALPPKSVAVISW